ncbi:MAG: T9SS type A sorting domain-containing protein, partial [Bacteroidota bacterium]
NSFSLALNSDGQIWAFGYNANGMLGIGTATNSLVPVLVSGSCQSLSVDQNHAISELIIYPNPTNGNFTIDFDIADLLGEKEIQVFNVLGQRVYNSKVDTEQAIISLSGKPNGIYICKVLTGNKAVKTGKIIIE